MKKDNSLLIVFIYISFAIIIILYLVLHLIPTYNFEILFAWNSIDDINIFGFSIIFLELMIGSLFFIFWVLSSNLLKFQINKQYKSRWLNGLNNFFSLKSSTSKIFDKSSFKLKNSFFAYGISSIVLNFIYVFLIPNPNIPEEILLFIRNIILLDYLFILIFFIVGAWISESQYDERLFITLFFILMFFCTIFNFVIQFLKIFYYNINVPFIDYLYGFFSFLIGRKIFQKYYEKHYKSNQFILILVSGLITLFLTLVPIITLEIYFLMHLIIFINIFRITFKILNEEEILFQSNDLEEFMEVFHLFFYNYSSENIDQSFLDKIKNKIYLIWDLNKLKIEYFKKLVRFFSEIENIFGESVLIFIIEKKKSQLKEILSKKQSFAPVNEFIIQVVFLKIDFFRLVFNENEREEFFKNRLIPIVNRKIDTYDDSYPRAKALQTLARVYDRQYGKEKEDIIINLYKESFEIFKELDILSAAEVKIDLANYIRRVLKQFPEAKKNIEEARLLLEPIIDKSKNHELTYANCLNVLGLIYYGLKTEDSLVIGRTLCEESKKIKNKWGDINGAAECENAIGLILTEQGKKSENINLIKEAIKHFKLALNYREKISYFRGCAQQYRNLGLAYKDLIKLIPDKEHLYFELSKNCFEKAIINWNMIKPKGPPLEEISEIYFRLGELNAKYGNKDEAIKHLLQVEKNLSELGDWDKRARCLDLLREVHKNHKEIETTNFKIVSIYKDILNDENKINEMRDDKIKFRNAKEILERTKQFFKKLNYDQEEVVNYVEEIDEIFKQLTLRIG